MSPTNPFARYTSAALMVTVSLLPVSTYAAQPTNPRAFVFSTVATFGDPSHGLTRSLSVHVGFVDDNSVGRVVRGTVQDGDKTVTFTVLDNTIILGDGYILQREDVNSSDVESIQHLRAITPDGREATAFVQLNKTTGRHFAHGIDKLRSLMGTSQDFLALSVALPAITSAAAAGTKSANGLKVASDGLLWCLFMWTIYVAETITFIAACGIPEPLEPIACAAALFTWVAAGAELASACAEP